VELESEGEFCDESEMSCGAASFEREVEEIPVSRTEKDS